MSRYESYMKASLCEEEEAEPRVLPRVVMSIDNMKLRVNPRVRWTKVVAQWRTVRKTDEIGWPITVHCGSQIVAVTSLQDPIGKTMEGTEYLLEEIRVVIGSKLEQQVDQTPDEHEVTPDDHQVAPDEHEVAPDEHEVAPDEDQHALPHMKEELGKDQMKAKKLLKIRVVCKKRPVKLNVSEGCLVKRLIRKLPISEVAGLTLMGSEDWLDPDLSIGSQLPVDFEEPIFLVAIKSDTRDRTLKEERPISSKAANEEEPISMSEKKQQKKTSSEKSGKKRLKSSASDCESDSTFDPVCIEYWAQMRAAAECPDEAEVDLIEDDDLALALALSASGN